MSRLHGHGCPSSHGGLRNFQPACFVTVCHKLSTANYEPVACLRGLRRPVRNGIHSWSNVHFLVASPSRSQHFLTVSQRPPRTRLARGERPAALHLAQLRGGLAHPTPSPTFRPQSPTSSLCVCDIMSQGRLPRLIVCSRCTGPFDVSHVSYVSLFIPTRIELEKIWGMGMKTHSPHSPDSRRNSPPEAMHRAGLRRHPRRSSCRRNGLDPPQHRPLAFANRGQPAITCHTSS